MKKSTLFAAALLVQLGIAFGTEIKSEQGREIDSAVFMGALLDSLSVRVIDAETLAVCLTDGTVAKVSGTREIYYPETSPGQSNDDAWIPQSIPSFALSTTIGYLFKLNQLGDFSCKKDEDGVVIVTPKNGGFMYRPWSVLSNLWKFWTPFPAFSGVILKISVVSLADFNTEMFQKESDFGRLNWNFNRWVGTPGVYA